METQSFSFKYQDKSTGQRISDPDNLVTFMLTGCFPCAQHAFSGTLSYFTLTTTPGGKFLLFSSLYRLGNQDPRNLIAPNHPAAQQWSQVEPRTRTSSLDQNFNAQLDHPVILLKCRFWFSGSAVRPESLCCYYYYYVAVMVVFY